MLGLVVAAAAILVVVDITTVISPCSSQALTDSQTCCYHKLGCVLDHKDEDQVVNASSPPYNQVHSLLFVRLDTIEYVSYPPHPRN